MYEYSSPPTALVTPEHLSTHREIGKTPLGNNIGAFFASLTSFESRLVIAIPISSSKSIQKHDMASRVDIWIPSWAMGARRSRSIGPSL